MRILFIVIMISGCSMDSSNTRIICEYSEDRKLLVEVLEEAVSTGPSKSKFSDFVTSIDRKYKSLYLVRDFEPSKNDCTFWYGYHQIVSFIRDSGTHESWPFVLSIVNGDRDITVGSYCIPPLIEPEPVPKK